MPPFHVCNPTPRRAFVDIPCETSGLSKHPLAVAMASRRTGSSSLRCAHRHPLRQHSEICPQDTTSGAIRECTHRRAYLRLIGDAYLGER
jgi:hypothetical protein